YEVGGPSIVAAEGQSFPLPAFGLLVSDVEVAAGITIREIGPRVFAVEGQVQVMASQMVHAADRFEHIDTQVEQGFASSSAAERFTYSAATDYGF
ncbi:hypothetical protein Tco_0383882, partial [Tanacetum coccineum]